MKLKQERLEKIFYGPLPESVCPSAAQSSTIGIPSTDGFFITYPTLKFLYPLKSGELVCTFFP
jgi:hypothetical protein